MTNRLLQAEKCSAISSTVFMFFSGYVIVALGHVNDIISEKVVEDTACHHDVVYIVRQQVDGTAQNAES